MLNPALLWLLPLVAIPVVLHLLNLFRLRTVELPTFRFLMESYVQQRRRIRLLEWLLMLLRTAVVAAVLVALARPVMQRFGGLFGGGRTQDVVLLVDAGITAGLVTDGVSGLHRLREAARAAAERLAPGDFVTLVRAGMEPRILYRATKGDGKRLGSDLDALEPDPGTADLAAGVTEALAGPPRGPRTLWIFSDAAARGWRRFADHPASRSIPPEVTLVVVDGGLKKDVPNVAILGDPPRAQKPVVGLPVEVSVRLDATADETNREVPVSVWLDDELVARVPVTTRPDGPATKQLSLVPPRAGILRGRLEIPTDAFPEDDVFRFVLNVEPRVGVLVIAPPDVQPLDDAALFVGTALAAPLEALARERAGQGGDAGAETSLARSLDVAVARADAVQERQVKDADVIVLADACPGGDRLRWLRTRLEDGAGAVVFAGPRLDRRAFAELVTVEPPPPARKPKTKEERQAEKERQQRQRQPALAIGDPVGDTDDETQARRLGAVDQSHPVFAAFAEGRVAPADDARGPFDTLVVLRHCPLLVPDRDQADRSDVRPVVDVLASLDDGTPLVAETRLGRGRLVVSGLAATPDWSNLPVHPAFVPIVLRSVQQVRPDRRVAIAESVRPYEPAPVRLDGDWRRGTVEATVPGGETRPIETVAGDSGLTGALKDTRQPGVYEFDFQPPAGGPLEPIRLGMAVNPEIESATFARLDEPGIRAAFGGRPLAYLAGTANDPVLTEQLGGRREIWRWLIAAAIAFMAAEFLLSTLAPPRPRSAGERPAGWRERITDWLGRAVGNVEAAT